MKYSYSDKINRDEKLNFFNENFFLFFCGFFILEGEK
jgi:hypothetical protein